MSRPRPPAPPLEVTRRALLAVGAAGAGRLGLAAIGVGGLTSLGALAGCGRAEEDPPPALAAALQREGALLEEIAATTSRHPDLSGILLAVAADHEAHRLELRRLAGLKPLPEASSPESESGPASPGASVPRPVPTAPADALAALSASENAAAAAALEACVQSWGGLAGTFASIGASEASHAYWLSSAPAGPS